MIKDQLIDMGFKGELAAHWIPWFYTPKSGKGSDYHPMMEYNSDDPTVVSNQLEIMAKVGVSVVLITYQGPYANKLQHIATMEMVRQIEQWHGMHFAFVLDPWFAKSGTGTTKEHKTISGLNHPDVARMLLSKSYIREGALLDFATGVDWSKILLSYAPSRIVWGLNTGFSWPKADGIGDPIAALKASNALFTMQVPGLCMSFFDGGMPRSALQGLTLTDPVSGQPLDFDQQNWGTQKAPAGLARYLPDRAGNYYFDQLKVTPVNVPYIALVTWNDYNERTAFEPWAAMLTGIRIA